MKFIYIPGVVFKIFQMVTVQLDLFYLVRIMVELMQSDFMACGHLNSASRQFIVLFLNWDGRYEVFADIYHTIFIIVFEGLIRQWEGEISIPNVNFRKQQILKDIRNAVVGLNILRVWKAVVLQYDSTKVKNVEIIVRLPAPNIVKVQFTMKISPLLQSYVQYNGGLDGDRVVWGHLKKENVRFADNHGFDKMFGELISVDATLHSCDNCESEKEMDKKEEKGG